MPYIKNVWVNGDPTKPVNASRLGHGETQYDEAMADVEAAIGDAGTGIGAALSSAIGAAVAPKANSADVYSKTAADAKVKEITGITNRVGSFSLGVQMSDEGTGSFTGTRSSRVPFILPVDADSVTVRLAHYNRKAWTAGPGAIGLLAMSVGQAARDSAGNMNGSFVAGTVSAVSGVSGGSIPSNGTYYSKTITGPFKANTAYLLAIAYNYASTMTITYSPGWMWTGFNGNYPNAANAVEEAATPTNTFPSNARFEVAFDYTVPLAQRSLVVVGDSLSQGYGAAPSAGYTRPFKGYSWPELYARRHRIPVSNISVHGTRLSNWADPAHALWSQVTWGGFDIAVNALGSNDLRQSSPTLAQMQADFLAVNANIRSKNGADTPIYAATVMPATSWGWDGVTGTESAWNAARNTIRSDFNNWLATLPGGISGVFDFATAVASPADFNARASQYASSDSVHLNYLANGRLAEAVALP